MTTHAPAADYSYYREGAIYWNSFTEVIEHLNRLITGDPDRGWAQYLGDHYSPVDCLLSLNCGNGWVEREAFRHGVIRSVVGTDIQAQALATARSEAEKIGMPARYIEMDTNHPMLLGIRPDWALNFAALHHATYIDRLVREVYLSLPRDGLLINYDYIGPHRNQYDREAWSRMQEIAAELPPEFRPDLRYPHLPTIMHLDPTEAVHSELVVDMIRRYFDIETAIPLGGAIAYQLLYDNRGLFSERETSRGAAAVKMIVEEDVAYTRGEIERSLFAFIVARKKSPGSITAADFARWSQEERERERTAQRSGGRYYPLTDLAYEFYGGPDVMPLW